MNIRKVRKEEIERMIEPYPMLTHNFVEYFIHPDRNLSDKTLLEIGAGHSTIFWGSHFKNVYSYESDPDWIQRLNNEYEIPDNVKIFQVAIPDFLTASFKDHIAISDYIIIDNNPTMVNREMYARKVVEYKKEDSQIILDNGTWNIPAYRYLRDEFFCRDFLGFNMADEKTVTSLFFERIIRYGISLHPIGQKQYLG